jgi:hypothetical protein
LKLVTSKVVFAATNEVSSRLVKVGFVGDVSGNGVVGRRPKQKNAFDGELKEAQFQGLVSVFLVM